MIINGLLVEHKGNLELCSMGFGSFIVHIV